MDIQNNYLGGATINCDKIKNSFEETDIIPTYYFDRINQVLENTFVCCVNDCREYLDEFTSKISNKYYKKIVVTKEIIDNYTKFIENKNILLLDCILNGIIKKIMKN